MNVQSVSADSLLHALHCLQDHTFPEGIALPIGGEDKIHTHMLLEMHYDNPEEISGQQVAT